ncbi:MAG: hypothetical protein WC683_04195 [bacterium]
MNLIDLVDRYLLKEDRRTRQSHYASDADACRRQLWYSWKGTEPSNPPTAGDLLKMRLGGSVEVIVEEALADAVNDGLIESFQKQVREEFHPEALKYPIRMKLDFLITENGGKQVIAEVKSMFGQGIKEIQKKQAPKPGHLVQTFLYVQRLLLPAILAYFGRDFGYRTQFWLSKSDDGQYMVGDKEIDWSEWTVEALTQKFAAVEASLESEEPPERDYIAAIKNGELREQGFTLDKHLYKTDWQCNYCRWRDRCWGPMVEKFKEGSNATMFIERDKKRAALGAEVEDADA